MSRTMLERILAPGGLTAVYQPILSFSRGCWQLHGFEALVRGPIGTHMHSADVLFEYVRRKGAEPEVDRRCAEVLFQSSTPLGRCANMNFNVHASTLEQDDSFPQYLDKLAQQHGWPSSQITVEIVEHAPRWSGHRFNEALARLRDVGFTVALDDIGLGNSNYRMILECRPDYFKIDRFLVHGAHNDYHRRVILRSVAELASSFGATVVAEGVDNTADLEVVLGEGVNTIQGYLLARPTSASELGHSEFLNKAAHRLPRRVLDSGECPHDDWLRHASVGYIGPMTQRAVC